VDHVDAIDLDAVDIGGELKHHGHSSHHCSTDTPDCDDIDVVMSQRVREKL
jgi:hypothetical protein